MSKLRYCIECHEAVEVVFFQTDEQRRSGLFETATVTKGLFFCVNRECSRYSLGSMNSYEDKPTKDRNET